MVGKTFDPVATKWENCFSPSLCFYMGYPPLQRLKFLTSSSYEAHSCQESASASVFVHLACTPLQIEIPAVVRPSSGVIWAEICLTLSS